MEPVGPAPPASRWWLLGLLLIFGGLGLAFGWSLFGGPALASQVGQGLAAGTPYFTTVAAPVHVSSAPAPVAGAPAPDFTLKSLDGQQVTLSQLKGHPVLINFWASWCPPCRLEMPDLVKAYAVHKAEGFVLLGLNATALDNLPDVKAFVKEFGITFPVLLDVDGSVEALYRLRGLPLSVFVDRQGIISQLNIGAMSADQIEQYIGEILK
jgi:peroxiredoxin